MSMFKTYGKKIREARKKKNLTQKKLGEIIGVTEGMISHVEAGYRRLSFEKMVTIKKVLNIGI